jgi:hypothetical protein
MKMSLMKNPMKPAAMKPSAVMADTFLNSAVWGRDGRVGAGARARQQRRRRGAAAAAAAARGPPGAARAVRRPAMGP